MVLRSLKTVRWKDGVYHNKVKRKHNDNWLKWPYPEVKMILKKCGGMEQQVYGKTLYSL